MNDKITLSPAEVGSGLSRIRFAEGLIAQLPKDHEGRNTWLLNYGIGKEAYLLRSDRQIAWDSSHDCAVTAEPTP